MYVKKFEDLSKDDLGIAGGKGEAVLFRHGEIIGKINEIDVISTLIKEINTIIEEK